MDVDMERKKKKGKKKLTVSYLFQTILEFQDYKFQYLKQVSQPLQKQFLPFIVKLKKLVNCNEILFFKKRKEKKEKRLR